jgi:hypothetical protein
MSSPLAFLQHGDFTIEQGCDIASFGYGDISVAHNAYINGTNNSTNKNNGTLVVNGGIGVNMDSNLGGTLTVISTSNLQTTFIDTSLGLFNVSGGNPVIINVQQTSSFMTGSGNLNLFASNGNVGIGSGLNNINGAVTIFADNPNGGINIYSGENGKLQLTAGSAGIQGLTSNGNINLTANNASASFVSNTHLDNQNVVIGVNGSTDSQLLLQSSGINTSNSAIKIITTNVNGNINLSNNNGLSSGQISNLAGSGGYIVTTNTGGPIQFSASAASSYFLVNSTNSNQNLTIGVTGATDSKLILQSSGTNPASAILIQNTNTAGGILLTNGPKSTGKVDINTGSFGLNAVTQIGGGINFLSNSGVSSFINETTLDDQNLTICVRGNTASALILCSQGTTPQAITLSSTGPGGGINSIAAGPININTSDTNIGINIGTALQVPINIGKTNSVTTINGNLNVKGTTTSVNSQTVEILDNIVIVNSGPSGTADGGMGIKRYQSANNSCLGDVVADTADNYNGGLYNTVPNNSTTTTFNLDPSDTSPDNYYNGWWVRIISGTGICQVRRIKNNISGVVTIYSTADQIGVLANPTPIEGLDFVTTLDNTSVYGLYPCEFILSIWDSSANEYALVCSPMVGTSAQPTIAHYVDLHINNLIANNIQANTINGIIADFSTTVILSDLSSIPVTITGFPSNCGIYLCMVRPTTAISTRPSAIFALGRLCANVCGQVTRIIGVRGVNNENLDIQWPIGHNPALMYRPSGGTDSNTSYTIRIMTI